MPIPENLEMSLAWMYEIKQIFVTSDASNPKRPPGLFVVVPMKDIDDYSLTEKSLDFAVENELIRVMGFEDFKNSTEEQRQSLKNANVTVDSRRFNFEKNIWERMNCLLTEKVTNLSQSNYELWTHLRNFLACWEKVRIYSSMALETRAVFEKLEMQRLLIVDLRTQLIQTGAHCIRNIPKNK